MNSRSSASWLEASGKPMGMVLMLVRWLVYALRRLYLRHRLQPGSYTMH